MSRKYTYFSASFCHEGLEKCVLCGRVLNSAGLAFHDCENNHTLVGICMSCSKKAETITYLQNDEYISYAIESGWLNNPVWRCPVTYSGPGEVAHLHVTSSLHEAPGVFQGQVSGLAFEARGVWWPIETRKGKLYHIVIKNDVVVKNHSIKIEYAIAVMERLEKS